MSRARNRDTAPVENVGLVAPCRRRLVGSLTLAWIVACVAAMPAQSPAPSIWDGVYTDAQAERGKNIYSTACVRCHGADLGGTTAPPLTGDRFMTSWGGESVDRLFVKIRDTMPPNFGTILDDSAKLDVVTYILRTGGYPSGARELAVGGELAGIRILRKGEQASVQNFSLVQTVGCLARGAEGSWVLTSTAEPAVTREDAPPPDALAAAAAKPLGTETFVLLSVTPFNPEAHVGRKMEARGLVYREPGDSRLTLTSLQPLGATCDS
jgi:mono/diheme cytochrome c family protein